MSLDMGRVAAIHPEDHSVDLVMVRDGSRLAGVQVLSWSASSNTGDNDLPTPETPPSGDKWSLTERTGRDLIAIVGYIHGNAVVLGFLFPQVSQLLFKDPDFSVQRHASDVYRTIDKDGNFELAHPSGTFLRIATDPSHVDLTGQDFDAKWEIKKNKETAVHVHLEVANAGVLVAAVDIDPAGNVNVIHDGNLVTQTGGTVAVTAAGAMTLTAATVAIVSGSLTHNGVNVGSTHTHSGITPGPGNTGLPG